MRENLWGVVIPDDMIERMDQAPDPKAEGIAICAELMQQLAETPGVSGVHLMAPVNLECIPEAIHLSGLRKRRSEIA